MMKTIVNLLFVFSILAFLSCDPNLHNMESESYPITGFNVNILEITEDANGEGDFLFKLQSNGEEFETYTIQIDYIKDGNIIADGVATGLGNFKSGEIIEVLTSSELINSTDDYDCTEYKILFTGIGSERNPGIIGPKCD